MDDEVISLPADTLAILNQFLAEKAQREQVELEKIKQKAGKEANFEEDWVILLKLKLSFKYMYVCLILAIKSILV